MSIKFPPDFDPFYPITQTRKFDDILFGIVPIKERENLPNSENNPLNLNAIWEIPHKLGDEIRWQFDALGKGRILEGQIDNGAHLLNRGKIYIGKNARIFPGAVLNAENGPIYISENVIIEPNAVLTGPLFIGGNSLIRSCSQISECSIGQVCKIGGEVAETMIQGYTNKQHSGFLGHAVIGEWCNLGADTTNSDLKNNYSNIIVRGVDTGSQFVGLMMGDHCKTAIGTLFNTGTVVGVGSLLFGKGLLPNEIKPFSWGTTRKWASFEQFLETAKIVMARRNVAMSAEEEKTLREIFED
ncbi:hypothetical protein H8D59_01655 [bacterium]|nr:hypothetical protein [bacterium]